MQDRIQESSFEDEKKFYCENSWKKIYDRNQKENSF